MRLPTFDAVLAHFRNRRFELAMAAIMFGVGVLLFLSPEAIESSSMNNLLKVMSQTTCMVLFLVFGVARIAALILNGHWLPWGSYVRAGGAGVGVILWSQWGAALFQLHLDGLPISPGVVVYGGLAFWEAISFYGALQGASWSHGRNFKVDRGQPKRMASDSGLQPVHFHHRNFGLSPARPEGF